jgi:peptidyl-tRNA hydrolase
MLDDVASYDDAAKKGDHALLDDEPETDARDSAPQYALPLVVRVERAAPPGRTDAMEAAARAVLMLLSDPRSTEGEWADDVRAWQDARIRKVVRRARGAPWQRVQELPGITVRQETAEVRVYPPVPVDDWPEDLRKLQVAGTELHDDVPPPDPEPGTPVLWLNPEITITAGKAMAQAGHAAHLAWWALAPDERERWRHDNFPLAVRTAPTSTWKPLLDSGLPVVRDGGFTEVEPGTATFVAGHPALVHAR